MNAGRTHAHADVAVPSPKAPGLLSETLHSALMALSLLLVLTGMFQYDFSLPALALGCVVFSLMWTAIFTRTKVAGVIAFLMGALLSLSIVQVLFGQPFWVRQDGFFAQFASWVGQAASQDLPAPPGYLLVATAILGLSASFVAASLVVTRAHPLVPTALGSALSFLAMLRQPDLPLAPFSLFLLSMALYLFRYRFLSSHARTRTHTGRFSLSMLPPCLLALALTLSLPGGGEYKPLGALLGGPFSLPASDDTPWWAFDADIFHFSGVAGFDSDTVELGGPRRGNPNVMLVVRTDMNVLLRGHIYGNYTGRSWSDADYAVNPYKPADNTLRVEIYELISSSYSNALSDVSEAAGAAQWDDPEVVVADEEPWEIFPKIALPDFALSLTPNDQLVMGLYALARLDAADGLVPTGGEDFALSLPVAVGDETYSLGDLLDVSQQEISFWDIRTRTLFVGGGTHRIDMEPPHDSWMDGLTVGLEGEMTLSAPAGRDLTYRLETLTLNLSEAERAALYRHSYQGLSTRFLEVLSTPPASGQSFSQHDPSLYARYLYDSARAAQWRFTALPESMPARVVDLAREITRDAQTDYDRAAAICQYLKSNYVYELNMPPTPEGRDFVDEFLFEQRRGYCTYFASAMAVMTRAVGLPARYVEGFSPQWSGVDRNVYLARGDNAHAWVEVYLDGFGWVEFDPTASSDEGGESSTPPTVTPGAPENSLPTPVRPDGARPSGGAGSWWLTVLLTLAGLSGVSGATWFYRRMKKKRRPGAVSPRERARLTFDRMARGFGRAGLTRKVSETPLEYGRRIDAWGHDDARNKKPWPAYASVEQVGRRYSELAYAPGMPGDEDVARWERDARLWSAYAKRLKRGG